MRKFSNIISLAACFVLLWGCDEYDDGELRQNIDAIEQELTETEKRVERLNEEMNSLSALINSSFISYPQTGRRGQLRHQLPRPRRRNEDRYPRHAGRRGNRSDRRCRRIHRREPLLAHDRRQRQDLSVAARQGGQDDARGRRTSRDGTSMPKDSGSSTASVSRTRKAIPYWPTMSATPSSRRWRPTKRAVWSASRSPTEAPSRFRCSKP